MRRYLIVAAAVICFALVSLAVVLIWIAPRLKNDALSIVEQRTGLSVSIEDFGLGFGPPLRLTGKGLEVGSEQNRSRPFVRVGELAVEARIWELWALPRRVRRLKLTGVKVELPPGQAGGPPPDARSGPAEPSRASPVLIDTVVMEDVEILQSSSLEENSAIIQIHSLSLESFSLDVPVTFEAQAVYPGLRGIIEVHGTFGPVNLGRAGETPVSGRFRIHEADLGSFDGITGLLTTDGGFEGAIESAQVFGTASLPNFMVNQSENVVPVDIEFEAENSGGDFLLSRVKTSFIKSSLLTRGDISSVPDLPGKTITLHTSGRQARVEDLIRFVLPGEAPLVGGLELQVDLRVLPGAEPFIDRFSAGGNFTIENGVFSRWDVQATVAKLSEFGSGSTPAEEGSTTVSDFEGDFTIAAGKLDFSRLEFKTPGTELQLTGFYGLQDQSLDFRGKVLMKRSITEMVPEQYSDWAKILEPVLRRGDFGTVVPIRITGTRSRPMFFPGF